MHGTYIKTEAVSIARKLLQEAICLKKITWIFYGYLELFAVCTAILRNPRLEKPCFSEMAQLQALENTTPLWVGRRSTCKTV